MGPWSRFAAWLKTARLRQKARAAARGPVAAHVASAALTYFGKHPAANECVIGPTPGQSQLFTRKDLGRLATITKGVGDRIFSRTLVGGAAYGSPGGWSSARDEQVQHYRHWSYLAVKAIGNELAGLVPSVAHVRHAGEPGAARKSLLERRHAKSLHAIRPHEDVEHAGPGHPLVRLFERPNAWDTAGDLWFELVLFLQLTGNAYLWTVPSRLGLLTGTNQPCELWVIPSHWVWPKLGPAGIDCYEVRPFQGPGTLHFPPEEIIHLRLKNPLHKIDGYSPQVAGAETIDALESVNRSRYWQFKNGCFPVGHLELGEQYADPSEEDLERVYSKFFRRFQGEQNYGAPIITGPGSKYNPLEIAPREMAYFESAEQLRDWVLALWGVPKEILGIQPAGNDLSWYAPMQQFCRFTLQPLLRYLGQALTRHLASRYDRSLRIWWEDPSPNSPDQINKDLTVDAANGWVTPNEARAIRGREAYPFGGEDPMLPPGLSPMPFATGEQLDLPAMPPQQPQAGGGFPPGKSFPAPVTKAQGPLDERAGLIAGILYGLYGADAARHVGGPKKAWSAIDHPRDGRGRFIPRGSPEAAAAAKEVIGRVLSGKGKAPAPEKVMEHLNLLTVKQLKALHQEHGQKVPGKLRAHLVAAVKGRLGASVPKGKPAKKPAPGGGKPHGWPAHVRDEVGRLLADPPAGTPEGMVSIPELRRRLDAAGPLKAPGFEDALRQMWRDGEVRLVPLSDLSRARPGELGAGLPGVNETLFYVEPLGAKKPRGGPGAGTRPQPPFTDAERQALRDYTGGAAFRINAALREGAALPSPRLEALDAALQSAFAKVPAAAEPQTLYRGLSLSAPAALALARQAQGHLRDGTPLVSVGYSSTTRNRADVQDSPVSMTITTRHGLDVAALSSNPAEAEVLLNRGARFRVRGVTQRPDGGWHLQLEHLGAAGKALPPARTKSAGPAADFPHVLQSEAWDCGAACLRAVAEHFGVLPPPPDREEAFIKLLGTNPEDGTRPGRIVEGARRLGLDAQAKGGMSFEDLAAEAAAGRVVICCTQQSGDGWDQGHYVTSIACTGKSVLVQDPVDGRKRVGRALWLKRWHDADADGQRYERFGIVIGKPAARSRAA